MVAIPMVLVYIVKEPYMLYDQNKNINEFLINFIRWCIWNIVIQSSKIPARTAVMHSCNSPRESDIISGTFEATGTC